MVKDHCLTGGHGALRDGEIDADRAGRQRRQAVARAPRGDLEMLPVHADLHVGIAHGGDGVRHGFAVESLYREIRALRIYEGASDVQRVVIARSLLG